MAPIRRVVSFIKRQLTRKDQLSRNPENRGGGLAVQKRTDKGFVMRAEDVVEVDLFDAREKAGRVDVMRRDTLELPSLDLPIDLPDEEILTLKAGKYVDDIVLPRDFALFPLTIGFLKDFSAVQLVDAILNRAHNPSLQDHEMPGYIELEEALLLQEMINKVLIGDVRVRLPSEALLHVFASTPEYAERLEKLYMFLSASIYNENGVDPDELEVELDRKEIKDTDRFAYYFRYYDPNDKRCVISRYKIDLQGRLNTSVMFEVVPR